MLKLPTTIIALMQTFRPLFREPTWHKAQILLTGAILTTGKRTVTASLRVMGLSEATDFAKYHQVLNRAVWSPRQASEILLKLFGSSIKIMIPKSKRYWMDTNKPLFQTGQTFKSFF